MNQSEFFEAYGYRILKSLRQIIRAVDIHSRQLNKDYKVTTPQMICLYVIAQSDGITQLELAREVDLGASTITGVIDRLEAKGLVTRSRQAPDRRKVLVKITESGLELTKSAPALLQTPLMESLLKLSELEQATIALSLERIVTMMDAEHLDTTTKFLSDVPINETPRSRQDNANLCKTCTKRLLS